MQTVDYAGVFNIIFLVNAYSESVGFIFFLNRFLQGSFIVSDLCVPRGTF